MTAKMMKIQQVMTTAYTTQRDVREVILMNDPERREQIKNRLASYNETNLKNDELLE